MSGLRCRRRRARTGTFPPWPCGATATLMLVCGDKGLPADDWGHNSLDDWGAVEMFDARDCVNAWVVVDDLHHALGLEPQRCASLMYRAVLEIEASESRVMSRHSSLVPICVH